VPSDSHLVLLCAPHAAGNSQPWADPPQNTGWDGWLGFPVLSWSQGSSWGEDPSLLSAGAADQGGWSGRQNAAGPYLSVPDKPRSVSSKIFSRIQLCRKIYWDWKAKQESNASAPRGELQRVGTALLRGLSVSYSDAPKPLH